MPYKPKRGDILLCYAPSLLGTAIDAVEEIGLLRAGKQPPPGKPVYSHAAVYLGPDPTKEAGPSYVIEALGRGVTRSLAAPYKGIADVWATELDVGERLDVAGCAAKMWRRGVKYSYPDIAIQFLALTTGLRISWRLNKSIICSVLAYDCYAVANRTGIRIAAHRNCCPEDIATYGALRYKGQYTGV